MFIYKTLLKVVPRQLSSLSRLMIEGSKSTVKRGAATEVAGTETLLHGKLAKKVTPTNSSNHIAAKPPNSNANGNGKVGSGEPVEGKRLKIDDSEKGSVGTGNQNDYTKKDGTQNGLGLLAKLDKKIDFSNNKATYLAPQFAALTTVFGAIIVGIIGIVLPIRYSNNELKKNNKTLQNANGKLQGDLDSKNTQLTTTQSELTTTQSELTTTQGELTTTQGELTTTQGELTTTQGELTTTQGELTTTQGELTTTQGELTETKEELGEMCTRVSVLRDEVDSLKRQESQSFLCNAFGLFCHNRPATENTSSDIMPEESNDQIVRLI